MLSEKYDAFEHLWRSIFPFDGKEKLVAMLTGYADESGNDGNSPLLAVAGYVSDVELWAKFQVQWKQFLTEEEIPLFHSSDMLALSGDFTEEKGWNAERVTRVMQRADLITKEHVLFGLVSYTDIPECEKWFPLVEDDGSTRKRFSAEYLFAGTQLAWGISRWARENRYSDPINYVFECGAPGKGYLMDALDAGRKTDPMIGGVAFSCKTRVHQLHPADKLAQQCRRALVRHLSGQETSVIMERLIATKLGKAYRMDSENLPLLRKIADVNKQLERVVLR
ncbi:MAG: hypothetical protein ACR2LM_17940 [Pyrinomonadaceae bacterium]